MDLARALARLRVKAVGGGRAQRAVGGRDEAGHRARRAVGHGGEAGQATVELVGMLPLVALLVLGVAQLLAAGAARELAGNAAGAGAAAILQGADPAKAARAALPGWSAERAAVQVRGRRVRVTLRPRTVVPVLAGLLAADAVADAGPAT